MEWTRLTFFQVVSREGPFQAFVLFLIICIWAIVLLEKQPFDSKLYEDSRKQRFFFPKTPVVQENPSLTGEIPRNEAGALVVFDGSGGNEFAIVEGQSSGANALTLVPEEGGNFLACFFEDCSDQQEIVFNKDRDFVYEKNPKHKITADKFFKSRCNIGKDDLKQYLCERNIKNGRWDDLQELSFWDTEVTSMEDAVLLRQCVQAGIEKHFKDFTKTKEYFAFRNRQNVFRWLYDRMFNPGNIIYPLWYGFNTYNRYTATLPNGKTEFWYVDIECQQALPEG